MTQPNGEPTPAPAAPAAPAAPTPANTTRQLPDDHPLVKTLAAQKDEIKTLKERAKKLDEIEESQKSEAQKAADRIAALEQENQKLQLATLRADVAAVKGVPAGLISGSTKEELEAAADALLAFKGTIPAAPSANGQGATGNPVGDGKELSAEEIVKAATGR